MLRITIMMISPKSRHYWVLIGSDSFIRRTMSPNLDGKANKKYSFRLWLA